MITALYSLGIIDPSSYRSYKRFLPIINWYIILFTYRLYELIDSELKNI